MQLLYQSRPIAEYRQAKLSPEHSLQVGLGIPSILGWLTTSPNCQVNARIPKGRLHVSKSGVQCGKQIVVMRKFRHVNMFHTPSLIYGRPLWWGLLACLMSKFASDQYLKPCSLEVIRCVWLCTEVRAPIISFSRALMWFRGLSRYCLWVYRTLPFLNSLGNFVALWQLCDLLGPAVRELGVIDK